MLLLFNVFSLVDWKLVCCVLPLCICWVCIGLAWFDSARVWLFVFWFLVFSFFLVTDGIMLCHGFPVRVLHFFVFVYLLF